jgi:acyl carrier protein
MDNLKSIIEENYDDINVELKLETEIFGETAIIDSLGLVDLIVALEEHLMDEYDIDIIVVDESSIIDVDSPFKSIRSLSNLIFSRINE